MNKINYFHSELVHNTKAAEHFLPYLFKVIHPKTVVDVGCGLGTWLKVFKMNGTSEILGIDGSNVDQSKLAIDKNEFLVHDLTLPIQLNKKFDLSICLEVAEHLPENKADILIETLTSSSNQILFSSALPFQGGQNHLNEKSFSYWVNKFNNKGFIVLDIFRNEIWNDENINWWYRQNIFFVKRSQEVQQPILDFYHPERYKYFVKQNEILKTKELANSVQKVTIRKAFKNLLKSIREVFN